MSHPQVPTPEMDDWQSFLDMETDTDSTASTHEIYLSNSNAVMVSQSASIPDFSDPDDRSLSPLSNRSRAVLLPATSSTTDRGRTPNNSPVSVHRTLKLQEDNGLSISYPGRRENTSLKRPLESEEGKDCKFASESFDQQLTCLQVAATITQQRIEQNVYDHTALSLPIRSSTLSSLLGSRSRLNLKHV